MSVELVDENFTVSTEDSAADESAEIRADPELADACLWTGPFCARYRRGDGTWIFSLLLALFIHAAFVTAVLLWWLTSPPAVALAGGSGSGEADSEMPGDGIDVSPVAQIDLPQPPDSDINLADGSDPLGKPASEGAMSTDTLRAIGLPVLESLRDSGRGAVGVSGESLAPPMVKHFPPPGRPGTAPAGVGPTPASGNRPPRYPPEALRRRLEGTVMLRVLVSADGKVQKLEIDRSSGHDLLDTAALEAVQGWRFRPAQVAGSASACEVVVPIRFVLSAWAPVRG